MTRLNVGKAIVAAWLAVELALPVGSLAEDWSAFGRDKTRNFVSPEKNAPTDWLPEIEDPHTGAIKQAAKNIKWSVSLGSRSVGGPVVA